MPIKLDVEVEMPDVLDLSPLRGAGPQPGEEPLPELVGNPPPVPAMDAQVLSQLIDMGMKIAFGITEAFIFCLFAGFSPEACKKAIFYTHNSGLEPATMWLMEHITDSDLSEPFVPPGTEAAAFVPNPDALPMIMGMGFTREQATKALKATDNNVERAVDWIFSHQEELDNPTTATAATAPQFRDGDSSKFFYFCDLININLAGSQKK